MSAPRKEHVIVEKWRTGGFAILRHWKCRCDWVGTSLYASRIPEMFEEHKTGGSNE